MLGVSKSKEKQQQPEKTKSKAAEMNNPDALFQWFDEAFEEDDAGARQPDEGGASSVRPKAGSDNDRFFAFIREAHLQEALEFRRKGYNRWVPGVDLRLVTQLRKTVADTRARLYLRTNVEEPHGSQWLLKQLRQIECFTDRLSDGMQDWVRHEVAGKSSSEAGETSTGSRSVAQSLVRRLESILQTLIWVVHTLRTVDDHNTPEKRLETLVTELTSAFSSGDENAVMQALERMTAEVAGDTAWSSLVQVRESAWEASKSAIFGSMSETARHEAKKANTKARELQGASQAFFSEIAAYLQSLSGELAKASVKVSQSAPPWGIQNVSDDEAAVPLSSSDTVRQSIRNFVTEKFLEFRVAVPVMEGHMRRFARVMRHGHLTETPSREREQLIADSIVRSILWQWQQPAIQIQYASGALLSKVDELQKIERILSSHAVAHDRGNEPGDGDIPVHFPDGDDVATLVSQWVHDRLEQEKPENQLTSQVVVLEQMLGGDIAHARRVLARLGNKEEIIQGFECQWRSVNAMQEMLSFDASRSLSAMVDSMVKTFMPYIAGELAGATEALNKALSAAGKSARHFSTVRTQAKEAQLLATRVREKISAESTWLTERPLDEYSRGARLARHWANLAREQNLLSDSAPDAKQVLSALKKQGLSESEGLFSGGDPEGYLFATRLAGELENARSDELRLPMSPEQYAGLEKGLVEYIVKWGQRRVSHGVVRIIIELSFEQALDVVTFKLSSLARVPYKILKASIKIPYKVNKVNKYVMPGEDKPYKAIYGLLEKKLKQLGFSLLMTPVPGVFKLAVGGGVTAGAALYNLHVGNNEKTFSAVYERMTEGGKSEKIKMDSLGGMHFDVVTDAVPMATFKGMRSTWQSEKSEFDVVSDKAPADEYPGEIDEETLPQAQPEQTAARNDDTAAVSERDTGRVSHSSPLQEQTGVQVISKHRDPASGQVRVRRAPPGYYNRKPDRSPAIAPLQPERLYYDSGVRYQDLTDDQKKQTYLYAINFVLLQIENDKHVPPDIRDNARLARLGARKLVPVDIYGRQLNNTFFLPDSPGSKSGMIICLNSEKPYHYIEKGSDLSESIKDTMPYGSDKKKTHHVINVYKKHDIIYDDSGMDILRKIRSGELSFNKYFNYNTPKAVTTWSLAERMANTLEADYKLRNQAPTNTILISRAIQGAHIPDPGVSVTEVPYQLKFTWAALTSADYLRSFARPFATLSGQVQLFSSDIQGDTVQETELKVQQAEYIGSWIDVTAGALTSFSPAGWVLGTVQSVADITADVAEGKTPDPLAVTGLIVGSIPGGRIAAKVGKFTRIGGKAVKYGLILGNKAVDLASVGESIKTAMETGEPLAIYQALLASGMSVKDSYDMVKNMSSSLKLGKTMEESASLEQLEALEKNAPEYALSPAMTVRTFRVGSTDLHGRINNGDIEISRDNGATWQKGSRLHLLAYRLQNAGGGSVRSDLPRNEIVIGGHTFKRVEYNQEKFNEMKRIAGTYTPAPKNTWRMAKLQREYEAGRKMGHAPQYNHYNNLSLDEKLVLFINPGTDAITRGVLTEKINESIRDVGSFKAAGAADDWKKSADKATDVVLSPQSIYLKGRECESLPSVILMGRALQGGQDTLLAKKLMDIYSSPDIDADPLYKSLGELYKNGSASEFSWPAISDVSVSTLATAESKLFPTENTSVRVDIPGHTVLISKVKKEDKKMYVFYDPNYGLAYFDKYKDMLGFFNEKIEGYKIPENSINFYRLDYSRLPDVKTNEMNLDEIVNGERPKLYRHEDTRFATSEEAGHSSETKKTVSHNGLLHRTLDEIAKDSRINSLAGLDIIVNVKLNEQWSLTKVNIKNSNSDTTTNVGSAISVTFTFKYNNQSSKKTFTKMPWLQWNEKIKRRTNNDIWEFNHDMYNINPKSPTFFSWINRYTEAYYYAMAEDKTSFNGNVKIYDKTGKPLSSKDIKIPKPKPKKMASNIRKYLAKNGGILEVTVTDLPSVLKNKEFTINDRIIRFSIGFDSDHRITFNQGISVGHDGNAEVFVTTSDHIDLISGDVNTKAPKNVSSLRNDTLSPGESN